MSEKTNRQIVLQARPRAGRVTPDLFALRAAPVPDLGAAEERVLVRNIYLSLDPAMRGWISDAPNYRDPVPLGDVMPGFTVGEVVSSTHRDYAAGDIVAGRLGWQEWALGDGGTIDRKVDPAAAPITTALHVMGHTGLTAYLGLLEVGRPREGETVVVSTAAGAVGSTVGQIARIKGCRTVGITGSDAKVRSCCEQFGYAAAINYKSVGDLEAALGEACPDGVDVYYDNVGGAVADAVMAHLNVRARIVVCGTMGIADVGPGEPQPPGPRPNRQILIKRARMEGFLVLDHLHRLQEALEDLGRWLRDGRLAYREDIVDGLENAPAALVRLLAGANRGKMIVRVGAERA